MGGQRWSPPLPLPTTRSDTPLRELSCTVCSSYHRLQLLNSYCLQGCLSQWCETRTIVTGDAKLTAGIYSPHQHSHDVHQCELFVCSLSLSPHTHTHTHTHVGFVSVAARVVAFRHWCTDATRPPLTDCVEIVADRERTAQGGAVARAECACGCMDPALLVRNPALQTATDC